jgi:diguanylate cyclase (GGDEF)-like protein
MRGFSISPETVLSSVVRITEQRNQQHLEDCLVSTLAELAELDFCGICCPTVTACGAFIDYVAMAASPGHLLPSPMVELDDDPQVRDSMASCGVQAVTLPDGAIRRVMPILDDREALGAFLVTRSSAGIPEQLALISGFAAIYRNYLIILRDAARDTLTGLKNRKTFDENFSRIVTNSRHLDIAFAGNRRGNHLAGEHHWLGMVDIDHFKRINDSFGHIFGDEVLLLLAALMRKAFRGEDLLFRFGGEEFVVMLAPTPYESALAAFNRFRATVAGFPFPQVGRVTVSIGFVRIHPDDVPSVVIGKADKALYFAKEHGRNQVQSFEVLIADGRLEADGIVESEVELF